MGAVKERSRPKLRRRRKAAACLEAVTSSLPATRRGRHLHEGVLERDLANLNLSHTKVFAPVGGCPTNVNTSPGTYVNEGEQLLALVDAGSFWIAAYFKETQLKHIRDGASARITLMGHDLEPFEGKVVSVAWGVFLQDGSTIDSLPIVSQTIDWVRLPNRFPVRIHVTGTPPVPLRIGQTVSVAVQGG